MSEPFTIATIALAGGGRIGICRLPGVSGNLDADLKAIAAWKPTIVVSMTEQAEMDRCGSGALGARLADFQIDWAHLPIRDYGGPDGDSRTRWPALSRRLNETLANGGAVLLHCRGGLGRSGMIALRLLVERGEEVNRALAQIRSVRPGAVETDGQLEWAARGAN